MKRITLFLLLALASFLAVAQTAPTATITFSAPTTYADGSAIPTGVALTYNLYQGAKGATKPKVGSVSSPATITTGLLAGQSYCWQVSAVANGIEGALSDEGCKTFPFSAPGKITITVQ